MRTLEHLVLISAISLCMAGCARQNSTPPPAAVFLIVADTLRPDRLSCYGYSGHTTKHIDALAEDGVLFANAQSSASWTVPSMGSMMTSRYPTQLGLVERPRRAEKKHGSRQKRPQIKYTLPRGVTTLAEALKDEGFRTVAFVNQPFINGHDGFTRGFEEWCYATGEEAVDWHDPQISMPSIRYPEGTNIGRADPLLVREFDQWLASNGDDKPFVWLHFLMTHAPYTPAKQYIIDYLDPDQRMVEPAALYEGEVRMLDDLVGEVLASIDRHVGLDRSLVVFTSDHGEEFGDHGSIEHGHSLHREVIEVPLIVASPVLPSGVRVDEHVGTIDVAPTVMELAGGRGLDGVEGRSLVGVISGDGERRPVYAEGMLYGSTERCLIAGGYKLMLDVESRPPVRLFEVTSDPRETIDYAERSTEVAQELRLEMEEMYLHFVEDLEELRESDPTAGGGSEDERVLRSLKALGYIGR